MRGRKPKPTSLHSLQGTRPSHPRTAEPRAGGAVGEPPAHLTAPQRALWAYYVNHAPAGLLKALDESVLATFVVAVDLQDQAARLIAADGVVVNTERGQAEHPACRTFARASALVLKCASELGLSPAARPRITMQADDAAANPFEAFTRLPDPARRPN